MKKVQLLVIAISLAGLATLLLIQNQAQVKLRQENESLKQQASQITDLLADNERLSNQVAQATSSRAVEQKETQRLRRELTALRGQTNELGKLRSENASLRQAEVQSATNRWTHEVLASPADPAEIQQRAAAIAKMNDARQLLMGMHMFADDNQGRLPASFDDARAYYAQREWTNHFDIVFQGSTKDIANPSEAIVIREKEAWPTVKGGWSRAYGFADGHAEIHLAPDGNFGPWEEQRRAKAKGQ
ncbi:MAG: hypothetical protein C5B50_12915 [Verrucomicrobia bacterium]|nr:MAG: hypothetical protein C5B50_12915 [Verrucomicrobiota bacterium]